MSRRNRQRAEKLHEALPCPGCPRGCAGFHTRCGVECRGGVGACGNLLNEAAPGEPARIRVTRDYTNVSCGLCTRMRTRVLDRAHEPRWGN